VRVKTHSRLRPDQRQNQLLELGMRHFLARSYEAISLDEVAEEAGVSKGLLYHYFPTKRAFYMACLRRAVEELRGVTEPAPGLPPADQLRRGLTNYLAYVESHIEPYNAVLRGAIGSDPEVAAIADGFRAAMYSRIAESLPGPPSRKLELAIKGWIGFVEAVSLDWSRRRRPSRALLVELLSEELERLLRVWSSSPPRLAVAQPAAHRRPGGNNAAQPPRAGSP
jgi:AcrR family transcriptional regulator